MPGTDDERVGPGPSSGRRPPPGRKAGRPARRAAFVIRRARDRGPPQAAAPAPRPLPPVEDLLAPEGRAVLEALIRRHGARASPLARALAEGWRRADGAEPGEADLRALLDAHGLLHSFQRRERDAALHALRASGGIRHGAAAALGIAPEAFDALLARSGAEREAEALRDERRREIRRRATLSERAHLLLAEAERLADLGILDEVGADLAKRLPEHLRALRAGGAASLEAALGRSLSLGREEVRALGRRLGLDLGDGDPSAAPGTARPPGRPGSRRRPPL